MFQSENDHEHKSYDVIIVSPFRQLQESERIRTISWIGAELLPNIIFMHQAGTFSTFICRQTLIGLEGSGRQRVIRLMVAPPPLHCFSTMWPKV